MTEIINETRAVALELLEKASLKEGDIVIVGCSSSEIAGGIIGKSSSAEIGKAVFDALCSVFCEKGIFIAAQCCEHLNRAVIVERQAAKGLEEVNVVPQLKAGGSFATAAYQSFKDPVALENIKADAGIDIGDTLIGMHLKAVAVPLRTEQKTIGGAHIVCARTRRKFIGGERAHYNSDMM